MTGRFSVPHFLSIAFLFPTAFFHLVCLFVSCVSIQSNRPQSNLACNEIALRVLAATIRLLCGLIFKVKSARIKWVACSWLLALFLLSPLSLCTHSSGGSPDHSCAPKQAPTSWLLPRAEAGHFPFHRHSNPILCSFNIGFIRRWKPPPLFLSFVSYSPLLAHTLTVSLSSPMSGPSLFCLPGLCCRKWVCCGPLSAE